MQGTTTWRVEQPCTDIGKQLLRIESGLNQVGKAIGKQIAAVGGHQSLDEDVTIAATDSLGFDTKRERKSRISVTSETSRPCCLADSVDAAADKNPQVASPDGSS